MRASKATLRSDFDNVTVRAVRLIPDLACGFDRSPELGLGFGFPLCLDNSKIVHKRCRNLASL
jgi:hypothetical protein